MQTGVYLLALRHPAVVARQLATIAQIAPGRMTFGVGVGGDDPSELVLCGIDSHTRGARTTEALRCLRLLMTGEEVEFSGRFFELHGAIRPAPEPPIPILVTSSRSVPGGGVPTLQLRPRGGESSGGDQRRS